MRFALKEDGMTQEKSCGAIVYTMVKGKRFYLIEQMLGGHHGVPKGHMEAGESEEDTALREIKEEVGLRVALDIGFRSVITYMPRPGIKKEVVYFIALSESMDTYLQADEVKSIEWLELDQALQRIEYKEMQGVMWEADAYLHGKDDLNGNIHPSILFTERQGTAKP